MPPEVDPNNDSALIRAYCADRSEEAFRILVERYLPAVWSTARRVVNGDAALAEDVAQEVFSRLAQNAHRLKPPIVLGGWLHRHSCFIAQNALRAATRRRARELTAVSMNAEADDPWPHLAPQIDAALETLSSSDRDAVVLRFFEKHGFSSIGRALGMSEDAARMKISRALEKLRCLLGRRTAAVTVVALIALLNEHAVGASPSGLPAQIVESALTRAGSAEGAGGICGKLTLFLRNKAAVAAAAVILLAGLFTWYLLSGNSGARPEMGQRERILKSPAALHVPPDKQAVGVTLRLVLVPEATAASLLADRWNGDDDTALLDDLLQRARTGARGVTVLAKLSGQCPRGGRTGMGAATPYEYPVGWSRQENGPLTPVETKTLDLGTRATVAATVGADSKMCDLNLDLHCNPPDPVLRNLLSSQAAPASAGATVLTAPEFRRVELNAQAHMEAGHSCLVAMTRYPEEGGEDEQQLFAFVTIDPLTAP
jgi:RNA polymerase sigma factor (sigma-70 family)